MTFLDTNVLVYSADAADKAKQKHAYAIVRSAVDNPSYVISSQVLNEFSNVALSKLRKSIPEVAGFVRLFRRINVVPVVAELTEKALSIKAQYGIQFYDSLVVAAAEMSGCDEILTEDLNDGQMYGNVKAVNPFKAE